MRRDAMCVRGRCSGGGVYSMRGGSGDGARSVGRVFFWSDGILAAKSVADAFCVASVDEAARRPPQVPARNAARSAGGGDERRRRQSSWSSMGVVVIVWRASTKSRRRRAATATDDRRPIEFECADPRDAHAIAHRVSRRRRLVASSSSAAVASRRVHLRLLRVNDAACVTRRGESQRSLNARQLSDSHLSACLATTTTTTFEPRSRDAFNFSASFCFLRCAGDGASDGVASRRAARSHSQPTAHRRQPSSCQLQAARGVGRRASCPIWASSRLLAFCVSVGSLCFLSLSNVIEGSCRDSSFARVSRFSSSTLFD